MTNPKCQDMDFPLYSWPVINGFSILIKVVYSGKSEMMTKEKYFGIRDKWRLSGYRRATAMNRNECWHEISLLDIFLTTVQLIELPRPLLSNHLT